MSLVGRRFWTLLTVDGRGNARDEALVDVVGVDHRLELFNLLRGKSVQERFLVLLSIVEIASDIGRTSLAISAHNREDMGGPHSLSHRRLGPCKRGKQSCTADPSLRDFSIRSHPG